MKVLIALMKLFDLSLRLILVFAKIFFAILDFIFEILITTRVLNKL